jgi:hypothetical protein
VSLLCHHQHRCVLSWFMACFCDMPHLFFLRRHACGSQLSITHGRRLLLPMPLQALEPQGDIRGMLTSCVGLVVAAFLNPVPRTLGFVCIGGYILLQHWHIVDVALLAQCVLYVAGAAYFVRWGGGGPGMCSLPGCCNVASA